MTAEQIIKEIEALPKRERERLVQRMRELGASDIPQDFIDALEDFEKERFVSMETALNEKPPGRVSYQYRAVEKFWRDFYRLTPSQKESVRRAWQIFKTDPFHPSLRAHEIHELSAKRGTRFTAQLLNETCEGSFASMARG
jgi:hypothetical protein